LLTRLYHDEWGKLAFDILFSPLLAIATAMLFILALWQQQGQAASWFGAGLLMFYIFCTVLPILVMDYSVRRVAKAQGTVLMPFSLKMMVKLLMTSVSTYFTGIFSIASASVTHQVQWRGITYDIKDPRNIRLLEYFPYSSQTIFDKTAFRSKASI
jgi:heme/copper-type cytochrome/quinol oxidase subunit 2